MEFRSEEYYKASLERIRQAGQIHASGNNYALAMYCSGLAVECMLRAFRWKENRSFEGRHDLNNLLKASGILTVDDIFMRKKGAFEDEISQSSLRLREAIGEVVILWHNNLRFASEASLKAFLLRIGRVQGIKGNPLKKNSQDLLTAARQIVERGDVLWTQKKKS